ncbi:hypothetical protein J7L67_08670 [bacterium]|nr:hypothetical protein [bacterium]
MKISRGFIFVIYCLIFCSSGFTQNYTVYQSNDGIVIEQDNKASEFFGQQARQSSGTESKKDIFCDNDSPVVQEYPQQIYGEEDKSISFLKKESKGTDDLDDAGDISEGPDIDDEITTQAVAQDNEFISEILLDPADVEQMEKLQIEVSIKPADVILLKNSESVEGVIRDKTQNIVSIETEYGLRVYSRDDIDFIDEISEKEKFYLLDKIEALQMFHKKVKEKKVEEKKKELISQEKIAKRKTEDIEKLTGQDTTNLFSLTNVRLEEIIKEFSQFPPDYWRYYHRKGDAQKAVLRLRRLERFAHPQIVETIKLYLRAFDNKIKELDRPDDSLSRETYRENYKKFFRNAEKRRIVLKDTKFN